MNKQVWIIQVILMTVVFVLSIAINTIMLLHCVEAQEIETLHVLLSTAFSVCTVIAFNVVRNLIEEGKEQKWI